MNHLSEKDFSSKTWNLIQMYNIPLCRMEHTELPSILHSGHTLMEFMNILDSIKSGWEDSVVGLECYRGCEGGPSFVLTRRVPRPKEDALVDLANRIAISKYGRTWAVRDYRDILETLYQYEREVCPWERLVEDDKAQRDISFFPEWLEDYLKSHYGIQTTRIEGVKVNPPIEAVPQKINLDEME